MSFYTVKIIVRLKFMRKHKMKMYLDDEPTAQPPNLNTSIFRL